MLRSRLFWCTCGSLVWLASVGLAQDPSTARPDLTLVKPEEVGMSSQKLAQVKPALQSFVDAQKIPGAIVVVSRRGKVVLQESVGWRDVDAQKPMEVDSILRFYSMTKPITSVAIMMLVEDGKLALDDPVSQHIPEFKQLKVFVQQTDAGPELAAVHREMTIRDLLRHTSGLTYGFFGQTAVDKQYLGARLLSRADSLDQTIDKLSRLPLLHQPGTRFEYSVSTDVLGHLIERTTGTKLDEFFQNRIFEPLGMRDTGFSVPPEKAERLACNYTPNSETGGLRVLEQAATSSYREKAKLLSGGGGLVSTAPDYIRFCQMLVNRGQSNGKQFLKPETVDAMTRNQLAGELYPIVVNGDRRAGVGFGLGFSVVVEPIPGAPYVPVGEFGWGGAASTHFWISPKDELAVVVLTQHMPFTLQLEVAVKPLVYDALETGKDAG